MHNSCFCSVSESVHFRTRQVACFFTRIIHFEICDSCPLPCFLWGVSCELHGVDQLIAVIHMIPDHRVLRLGGIQSRNRWSRQPFLISESNFECLEAEVGGCFPFLAPDAAVCWWTGSSSTAHCSQILVLQSFFSLRFAYDCFIRRESKANGGRSTDWKAERFVPKLTSSSIVHRHCP